MTYVVDYDLVKNIAYEADLDEDQIRVSYSGRAMYGKECLGLVCTLGDLLNFVTRLGYVVDADDEVYDWITSVREDNMGLGTIYYWPRVQVQGAP